MQVVSITYLKRAIRNYKLYIHTYIIIVIYNWVNNQVEFQKAAHQVNWNKIHGMLYLDVGF